MLKRGFSWSAGRGGRGRRNGDKSSWSACSAEEKATNCTEQSKVQCTKLGMSTSIKKNDRRHLPYYYNVMCVLLR